MEPTTIAIFGAIIGVYGWLIKVTMFSKNGKKNGDYVRMAEFEKHKEAVQYKDTCTEIVNRIDERAKDRHKDTKEDLKEIKELIRNNGHSNPRIRT